MKYLQSIFEYRKQLELPFQGKDPLHDKPIHVHVIDALKDIKINKDPDNYKTSNSNINHYINKNMEQGFEKFKYDDLMYTEPLEDFMINLFPPNDYEELYNHDFLEQLKNDDIINDIPQVIGNFNCENLNKYLTDEGIKIFENKVKRELYEDRLESSGFYDGILQDDDGLILIWRSVVFSKGNRQDSYQNILDYRGLGEFWSWDIEGAEAHWGQEVNGLELIIHAKVKPENVDWGETLYKNSYYLNYEMEINIKNKSNVLVYMLSKPGSDNILDKKINIDDIIVPV